MRSCCGRPARRSDRWQDHPATRGLQLSVNITANQLSRPEFITTVAEVLAEAGVDPTLLTLELTEHVMLDDVVAVGRSMARLKGMGVKLALDDFGTGYSSLTYLRQLPLDMLKIDRSFVREIETNASDRAIVETILNFAANLGLSVVAEGVETERQMLMLRQHGCRVYQGFLFARPMPLERIRGIRRGGPDFPATGRVDHGVSAVTRRDRGSGRHSRAGTCRGRSRTRRVRRRPSRPPAASPPDRGRPAGVVAAAAEPARLAATATAAKIVFIGAPWSLAAFAA